MYSMIRRQVAKPAASHVNQLARASYHGKVQSHTKSEDEFFVNASYRDDFESSFLKADILDTKADLPKEPAKHGTPGQTGQTQTKPGGSQSPGAQTKRKEINRPMEREREPEIDEM